MKNIHRRDIELLAQHSDLGEEAFSEALKQQTYPDKTDWNKFLSMLFLVLGVGFTVSGIVFFFAYNWADLHKFVKIGLVQGLLVVTTLIILIPRMNDDLRAIILTGSSILIGVLFAVFGQIYQTGANAYDFFLAWTIFVTAWVCISNFPPLWLIYVALLNTTVLLYNAQVADWSAPLLFALLVAGNALIYFIAKNRNAPDYFNTIIGLTVTVFATIGMVEGIMENSAYLWLLSLFVAALYATGLYDGIKRKSTFYLSTIPFSLIIICCALFLKISNEGPMLLLISIFIIISVTLVILNLNHLSKENHHVDQK